MFKIFKIKLKVGNRYLLINKTTNIKYHTILASVLEFPDDSKLYNFSGLSSLTEEKLYKYYIIKRG